MGVAPIKSKTTCTNVSGVYAIKVGATSNKGNGNAEPGGGSFRNKM
jgi:hypothetical protein